MSGLFSSLPARMAFNTAGAVQDDAHLSIDMCCCVATLLLHHMLLEASSQRIVPRIVFLPSTHLPARLHMYQKLSIYAM